MALIFSLGTLAMLARVCEVDVFLVEVPILYMFRMLGLFQDDSLLGASFSDPLPWVLLLELFYRQRF
jgi:hypothetical protein